MSKHQGPSDKTGLKLVVSKEMNPPPKAPKLPSHNFWNTCPLQLEYLPKKPCELGEKSCKIKHEEAAPCPWSINSKEHNYCFWKYIHDNSLPNGQMRPLLQNQIATLMGCSATKVHFTERSAKDKLKTSGQLGSLSQLISGQDPTDDDAGGANEILDRLESGRTESDE